MTLQAQPLFYELPYQDPIKIFAKFADKPWSMLLHSGRNIGTMGRYSFIALEPFKTLRSKNGNIEIDGQAFFGNPFDVLREQLKQFQLTTVPDLPPLQGGVVGYFGYELYQHLENLPVAKSDDLTFPDMALGFYNLIIAFDHQRKKAWIFSSAHNNHAQERLAWLLQQLDAVATLPPLVDALVLEEEICSNFTSAEYNKVVQKVRDYIYAGDIFQANISQRFSVAAPSDFNGFNLYRRLAAKNPASFASYLHCGDTLVISASPERFLQLTNNKVETCPIKGTRPRATHAKEDRLLAAELQASAKDRAENIMIVDLMRNDLSRVCSAHSVQVPQLCGLESFATVHHLVSVVTGELRKDLTAIDLLTATFPGGSITGAPKIRAMEIIAEIEPTVRGPYCGCIGYIGFNGDMDTAITIRTFAIKNNVITFQAGGGIVADSDPAAEYQETLHKAVALRNALLE